ncbi:hypothetical protein Tco_1531782 [Tanacetum coccineum]
MSSKQPQQQFYDAWSDIPKVDEYEESREEDLKVHEKDASIFYGPQRNPNEPPRFYIIKQRKERSDPKEVLSDHKIIEVVIITTDEKHGLDFMEEIIMKRDDNQPYRFTEADFKYLNKDDIEDMYYLCLNMKVNFSGNQKLSDQSQPHITTLTILGIENLTLYSAITEPVVGIAYENSEKKKRFMGLIEIPKFYDATLERVVKEVSLVLCEAHYKLNNRSLSKSDKTSWKSSR